MEDEPTNERQLEIICSEANRAGVWANFARVSHSPYEFTIDFARLDFDEQGPIGGVVVQRVSVSPLFVSQLIEALQVNWSRYAERAMPPEVVSANEPTEPTSSPDPDTGTG